MTGARWATGGMRRPVGTAGPQGERGHALVEVVTAVALLAVTAVVTTGAVRGGVEAAAAARTRLAATTAALNAHEAVRARDLEVLVRTADAAGGPEVAEVWAGSDRVLVTTRVGWSDPPGVGPGCTDAPGEALVVETRARAVGGGRSDASAVEVVLVTTRAVPHRPGAATAGVVVRIDDVVGPQDGTSLPAPVAGAAVLLDGPLEGPRTVRLATTDDRGCAAFADLARGSYRVLAAAPDRVDAWHRAGPWPLGPDAADLDPATLPSTVVSTAPRARPTVRIGLALAATVGVEVVLPDGAVAPSGPGLRWWLEDGSPPSTVEVAATRRVAPGARDVHLGPCRTLPAAPAGRLEAAPGATVVVPVSLRAVEVRSDTLAGRSDPRIEGDVACTDGTVAVLTWELDVPADGARLALPPVPVVLRAVADGATIASGAVDPLATTVALGAPTPPADA